MKAPPVSCRSLAGSKGFTAQSSFPFYFCLVLFLWVPSPQTTPINLSLEMALPLCCTCTASSQINLSSTLSIQCPWESFAGTFPEHKLGGAVRWDRIGIQPLPKFLPFPAGSQQGWARKRLQRSYLCHIRSRLRLLQAGQLSVSERKSQSGSRAASRRV